MKGDGDGDGWMDGWHKRLQEVRMFVASGGGVDLVLT